MHILLIHQFFLKDHEGGGARWNETTRIWIECGHNVTVLAGNVHYMSGFGNGRHPRFSEYTSAGGARVISCYVAPGYHSGFVGRIWSYLSFVLCALYAGLFLVKIKCDAVIVTSPPLFVGLAGWLISVVKRIPFVFEVRDLWPESAIETGILKNRLLIRLSFWLEATLYRKASLINVLTPAFRDFLISKKSVRNGKIVVIPNAADFVLADKILAEVDRNAVRNRLGWENRFVLIYAGAHGVANSLTQILQAAALLSDTNAHFVLIGDGPEKRSLIAEAHAKGLNNITFIDPLPKPEVLEYICSADAGMSVLKQAEIFKTIYSNKTFDYFSCQKPVLLAIGGASRELVESANAGIFVEPENPQDLAEKIRYYMDNPSVAATQGMNGYLFAKKHFDREVLAKRYLTHIIQMVEGECS
ncbi:glycosyltransferase family 4 protein [Dyadobacter sp. CY343]|uniref:glycosyltransferase family 4 protein n=1 Tax=Dyadobacter sp. CY343 TaxID=2907299 RepID=UPI001F19F64B|nr:glycosyltransferase family 4 protein [Dyadobacter sp. CY343]MCE7062535.1 glycosyltransferase family 4 protein [Dyadobacter sp. CY343]